MSDPKTFLEILYRLNGEEPPDISSCNVAKDKADVAGGTIRFPLPKFLKKLYMKLACNKVMPVHQPALSSATPELTPSPTLSLTPDETPIERVLPNAPFDDLIMNNIASFMNVIEKNSLKKAFNNLNVQTHYTSTHPDIVKLAYLLYEITNILYNVCFKENQHVYKTVFSLAFENDVLLSIHVVHTQTKYVCNYFLMHSSQLSDNGLMGTINNIKLYLEKTSSADKELSIFLKSLENTYKTEKKPLTFYDNLKIIKQFNVTVLTKENTLYTLLEQSLISGFITPLINNFNQNRFPAYLKQIENPTSNGKPTKQTQPLTTPIVQNADILSSYLLKNHAYITIPNDETLTNIMNIHPRLQLFILNMIDSLVSSTLKVNETTYSTSITKIQLDIFKTNLMNVINTQANNVQINKTDDLELILKDKENTFEYNLTIVNDNSHRIVEPFIVLSFQTPNIYIETSDNKTQIDSNGNVTTTPLQPGGAIRKKKYELLTVAELKERCVKRKIKIPKGSKKADIIQLLRKRK